MRSFKLAIVALFALLVPALAGAGSITFHMKSDAQYTVALAFYSQHRNAAWPGNGNVYLIDDYEAHRYKLNCHDGEYICYGAWVKGSPEEYWGVGRNNANRCEDCCYTCGRNTQVQLINLHE